MVNVLSKTLYSKNTSHRSECLLVRDWSLVMRRSGGGYIAGHGGFGGGGGARFTL